jgi:hypothetical protein
MTASAPSVSMVQMRTRDADQRVPTAFVPTEIVPTSAPTHSDDWELFWDTGAICPDDQLSQRALPERTRAMDRRCLAGLMRHRLYLDAATGETGMAYFPRKMDGIERGSKIVADVFVALFLLAFVIVFFGVLGGLVAFAILEAALLAVDYLVPDADDVSGAAVR